MNAMATPVGSLSSTTARAIDDPLVRDVLREMEVEATVASSAAAPAVAAAVAAKAAMPPQLQQQQQQPVIMMAASPPPQMLMLPPAATTDDWWVPDVARRAAVAAVVAFVMLHPGFLAALRNRAPAVLVGEPGSFAESLLRVALLALVLYLLMARLGL